LAKNTVEPYPPTLQGLSLRESNRHCVWQEGGFRVSVAADARGFLRQWRRKPLALFFGTADVTIDPVENEVGYLEVVVLHHEHVAVAGYADVGQR
jgi:hypothetical protein